MIGHADTIGVFQIESRAQMAMLPRLKPKHYYDLVIEVAIVRPGPIQGGMVHPYLAAAAGLEPVTYPSEAVKGVLERTHGRADFPGAGDAARAWWRRASRRENPISCARSMAAWKRKGGLEPFEKRLVDGMRKNGYERAVRASRSTSRSSASANTVFRNRTRRASRSLVYASSWLKCYEPGGVHLRAPQLAAHGVLFAVTAHPGFAVTMERY